MIEKTIQQLKVRNAHVEIDGSYGEGGGQIIRTACALSALTGLSCRISKIRAGRKNPGLRAQHCAAIKGLRLLSGGRTSPLKVGKDVLTFTPGVYRTRDIELDIGSAGAIGLVLQALMLAGLKITSSLNIIIHGGTDVPQAPSCDYIQNIKLDLLRKMGCQADLMVHKRGFYPKGGGFVEARLIPLTYDHLKPLHLTQASAPVYAFGISFASATLKEKKPAEKQKRRITKTLTDYLHVPAKIKTEYSPTKSPGSGLVLWTQTEESTIGASALSGPKKTTEQIAQEAVDKLMRIYHSGATVDPWLGDQILPYLAFSSGPSEITVPYLSRHMKTNMWVIQQFLKVRFYCENEDQRVRIHCQPQSGG